MAPSQIGRYQILELLGQGGMGEVYRAHDPHLNRDVVIKFINLIDSSLSDGWRQRFRREVQAAGSLRHLHIVTVYDVALEHEPPYLVMELLTGGNLKDRLKGKLLPWREVLTLLRPLAEALAYAHRAGVIHRDVKPENVMFAGDEADTLKLVDFGLARQQERKGLTQVGTVMGTPAYMSPEQALGEVVDGRTDIFAFGIILFEAIVGRNPLYKGSLPSTMAEVMSNTQIDLSPLDEVVPLEVINLIGRIVAKNRDQRYPTCEALLSDLDICLGNSVEIIPSALFSSPEVSNATNGPEIRVAGNINLTANVETVLRTMFNNFGQVAVETEFARGLSGSRVFQIRLVEKGGRAHLPAVVKIAPIGLIQQEWQAYQTWVEHTLPNIARLDPSPILPTGSLWGGLRYALVGAGTFEVQSLHEYFHKADINDLLWVLEKRLFEIMGPNWWLDNRANRAFQMQTDYDSLLPVNLLIKATDLPKDEAYVIEAGSNLFPNTVAAGDQVELKNFVVTEVASERRQVTLNLLPVSAGQSTISYRVRLEDIPNISHYQIGHVIDSIHGEVKATRRDLLNKYVRQALGETIDLSVERLPLSTGHTDPLPTSLPNPLLTYQSLLQSFVTVNISTIHGDLNLENVLIDPATRDASLIDFATVRQGHALHDLLRLETEVVIKLIPPILAEVELPPETICSFYEQLRRVTLYSDQSIFPDIPLKALEKPFMILRIIRRMARKCLFNADDWQEYYQGLILYLLGTLKFKNMQNMPTAPLPGQTAFWAAAVAQYLLDTPLPRQAERSGKHTLPPLTPPDNASPSEIESPFGTMRSNSRLYIERAVDDHCRERISTTSAATLYVQAPRQMGKSSLMRRVLDQSILTQQKTFAFIDFQKFPEYYYDNEEDFLIEFCLMIGDALELPEAIDQYWQGRRTNIMKCSRYLSDYVIPQLDVPLILAMDEVERMLTSPFRSDFFGMLRTWHNDRVHDENLAKLTLFLSSSTEPYLFIDNPNQSPFNVAEVFKLEDFTREEVEELNRRHDSPLDQEQLGDLMGLINGHPFLTRLALYLLVTEKIDDFDSLLTRATEDNGPFADHLHHYLLRVLQKPDLKQALVRICRDHAFDENQIFYRLQGAGLIKKSGKQVILRNKLYDRYFKERLNV